MGAAPITASRDLLPSAAIGGIGGSGTRVGASLLQLCGYYIGADLNEALDNLWFTLLFKRRSVLMDTADDFRRLAELFFAKMANRPIGEIDCAAVLHRLTERGRPQHDRDWLAARASSFAEPSTVPSSTGPWAWKEPNTHIVIDQLLAMHSDLRYIHFVRHPLDMALSDNKNQLETWGPILLDRDVTFDAKDALAYWCAAHQRIASILGRWPERSLLVDFDALCETPEEHARRIAEFLGFDPDDALLARWRALLMRPASTGRFRSVDLTQFDPGDLDYVASLGFRAD